MIEIYVVRHGSAEDEAEGGDALRALTPKARKRLHKTARNLADRSGGIDAIYMSPLVRAVQTAEVLAGTCKPEVCAAMQQLEPSHSVDEALSAVARRAKGVRALALVGHEPLLSSIIAALVRANARDIDLRTGTVVRIDVDKLPKPSKAVARWWMRAGRHKGLPLTEQAEVKRAASAAAKAPAPKKEAPKKAAPKRKAPGKAASAPPPAEPPETTEFDESPEL